MLTDVTLVVIGMPIMAITTEVGAGRDRGLGRRDDIIGPVGGIDGIAMRGIRAGRAGKRGGEVVAPRVVRAVVMGRLR